MKCLVDNQLLPALAQFLTGRGIEAEHVSDIGFASASDREIWRAVTEGDYVLVTKDQDFLPLCLGSDRGYLLWIRIGNCRTAELLKTVDRLWSHIEAYLARGDRVIELW